MLRLLMQSHRPARRLGMAMVGASVAMLCLGEARADSSSQRDWTTLGIKDVTGAYDPVPFCFFFVGPNCTHTAYIDGLVAYQRSLNSQPIQQDFARLAIDLGYAVRLGRLPIQLGPAFEVGGAVNSQSEGWHVIPKLRGRLWVESSILGFEVATGFVYESHRRVITESLVKRLGVHGELGITVAGVLTVVGGAEWLRDPNGAPAGNLFIGGRLSLPILVQLLSFFR